MARRYSALLFDLDGTLIDSGQDLIAAVQHGFQALGSPAPAADAIVTHIGKPLVDFPQLLGYDFTDEQCQNFAQGYRSYYSQHCADRTTIYPDVPEVLTALRLAGIKTAVVTTKSQAQAEVVLSALRLRDYFDYVHGWLKGRRHKPDPEPVRLALGALGADASCALMVGDSEQDILAAQAAGVDACACLYGYRGEAELLSFRPSYALRQFREIVEIVLRPH